MFETTKYLPSLQMMTADGFKPIHFLFVKSQTWKKNRLFRQFSALLSFLAVMITGLVCFPAMSKAAVKISGDLLSNPLCEQDQAFLESMNALDTAMKRMDAFNQEKVRFSCK